MAYGLVILLAVSFLSLRPTMRGGRGTRAAIAVICAVLLGIALSPTLAALIGTLLEDDQRYSQLVLKSSALLNVLAGEASIGAEGSLLGRVMWLEALKHNIGYLLLPIGLGPETAIRPLYEALPLNTVDSGVAYFAVHFGILPGFLIWWAFTREMLVREWSWRAIGQNAIVVGFWTYFVISAEVWSIFELAVATGVVMGSLANRNSRKSAVAVWRKAELQTRTTAPLQPVR